MLGGCARGGVQNISHTHLRQLDQPVDSDVLVASDDDDAKHEVAHLVEAIPACARSTSGAAKRDRGRSADAGDPHINKRYKAPARDPHHRAGCVTRHAC